MISRSAVETILASSIGSHLWIGLAVAAVFSVAIAVFSIQRMRYLCVLSFIGCAAYYWQAFVGFLVVGSIAYLTLGWLARRAVPSSRWRYACIALVLLIAVFTLGRLLEWDQRFILPGPAPVALYSLDMWLALRLVTLFWEVGSGAIALPSFSTYLFWICLPLTVAGPLLRYSQLPATPVADRRIWKTAAWWMEMLAGAVKLVSGLVLSAAAPILSTTSGPSQVWAKAALALITGPFGFYLTFAGYYQLMEVLGRPCGFTLPVSFNFPIGRENISAFWANWNITATNVFRDYLFYNRWGLRTYHVYFNVLVLFGLVGLWHAANAYWVLWGLLHGVLFCVFLIWRKYHSRFQYLPWRGTVFSQIAARLFTYLCVCACWYLPSKILQKFARL